MNRPAADAASEDGWRRQLLASPALVAEGRRVGDGVLIGAAARLSPPATTRRRRAGASAAADFRPAKRLDAAAEAERYAPVVRRGPRWGLITLVVGGLTVLLVALGLSLSYAKGQYFVAAEDGFVAIFQGFPGDIAGIATHRTVETTEIALADLPTAWRLRVDDAIAAGSGGLDQARRTVGELARESAACLARRAERLGPDLPHDPVTGTPDPATAPTSSASPDPDPSAASPTDGSGQTTDWTPAADGC
jgi:protein phosphatase